MKRILLIPGDGIGPEVMAHAESLLHALSQSRGIKFILDKVDWGAERWLKERVGIPAGELFAIPKKYDALLFGALGDPRIPDMAHGREILLKLRTGLDLFINLRPIKLLSESLSVLNSRKNIDIIIFRENTQDLYAGAGGALNLGTDHEVAIDESIHTYEGVKRIINEAFLYAERTQRSLVTLVDKSNAIRFGGSLWQRVFKSTAQEFPHIRAEHRFVDVAAMQMVQDPGIFDVVVTSNLFGDILSDLGAGITGGLGLAASANLNPRGIALFEPVHGSAPDIAGQDKANPFAMFMTVAMMLDYFGYKQAANDIENALKNSIEQGNTTPDLGGSLSSRVAADRIIKQLI
jgi:3-isopropylmalate dehydrogenase